MQCPQCKNEVRVAAANFGTLYTCPQCMAVYFINFDGTPEYGDMTPQPIVEENIVSESILDPSFSDPFMVEENIFAPPLLDSAFSIAANEITDYGNQEEVVSQISYDVAIKGLDTKEVKQAFKESIDDSKFAWHTDDIMGQIKNGESHLKNLNPIQAFVLAQRIQFLDLEIEWTQNVAF